MLGIGLVFASLLALLKICIPMFSHRGRRLLYGRWLRLTRWEYWPTWLLYPPIVLYILWLGLKHRSLTVVTAVNPCMPAGGIIGESKTEILEHIRACLEERSGEGAAHRVLPASCSIPGDLSSAARLERVHSFMKEHALEYPLVLKPDAGQRGSGVEIVRVAGEVPEALTGSLSMSPHRSSWTDSSSASSMREIPMTWRAGMFSPSPQRNSPRSPAMARELSKNCFSTTRVPRPWSRLTRPISANASTMSRRSEKPSSSPR